MSRPWARGLAQVALLLGVLALQYGIGVAYASRGTWWHYLLHQSVGWGVGLALAGAVMAVRRRLVLPVVPVLLVGQLLSIVPDLMFRFLRVPHHPSMDLWLGHISIHRGPAPVLVTLAVLLLGAASWWASAHGRARPGLALAAASAGLLVAACLLAEPVPGSLAELR